MVLCVVEEITKASGQASAVQADLSNPEAVASLVQQAVEGFGGLDVIVNNASISASITGESDTPR
jgi:NAD(P)-dependent dehydrogenase (short-subunit alcohol dehydrogenase family)